MEFVGMISKQGVDFVTFSSSRLISFSEDFKFETFDFGDLTVMVPFGDTISEPTNHF